MMKTHLISLAMATLVVNSASLACEDDAQRDSGVGVDNAHVAATVLTRSPEVTRSSQAALPARLPASEVIAAAPGAPDGSDRLQAWNRVQARAAGAGAPASASDMPYISGGNGGCD